MKATRSRRWDAGMVIDCSVASHHEIYYTRETRRVALEVIYIGASPGFVVKSATLGRIHHSFVEPRCLLERPPTEPGTHWDY